MRDTDIIRSEVKDASMSKDDFMGVENVYQYHEGTIL